MGGVRSLITGSGSSRFSMTSLQWGPPGMGGVSCTRAIVSNTSCPNTSMGTSRNGRCEPALGALPRASLRGTSMGTSRNGRCEPRLRRRIDPLAAATSMGTSRNGRCEDGLETEEQWDARVLQWGPPGMGGVSAWI